MKVLVVDDDLIALEMLANSVTQFGYEVSRASNGREALERMRRENPRIVVTDFGMPGMDGAALCREIRRRSSLTYTYTVLLTSHGDSESVVQGLNAGADDYMVKPFRPEELRLRLETGKRLLTLEGRDLMIFSLAKLAESRDTDTGKHLDRIREYCRVLARELSTFPQFEREIDGQFIDMIYLTSPLHDVGKVGIPDRVLLKPGKLTPEEFDIMKQHTTIGSNTLKASANAYPDACFLKMAYEIALMHHERWDGTGYPSGLKGDEIPLSARIVAVADVYDALTTKRVYKPAFTHEKSLEIIREGRGSHFCPEIVDAFFNVENEILEIRSRLEEIESHFADGLPLESVAMPTETTVAAF